LHRQNRSPRRGDVRSPELAGVLGLCALRRRFREGTCGPTMNYLLTWELTSDSNGLAGLDALTEARHSQLFKSGHNAQNPSRGILSAMAILQQLRALWSRLPVTVMPIIRRRGQPPNVPRFFQINSAVSRLVWIDIHDVGYCPFA